MRYTGLRSRVMTSQQNEADVEATIGENVNTLLFRAGLSRRQLSLALGYPQATFARKVAGTSPWGYVEVRRVAEFFRVATDELAGDLPSREDWQVRWDDVRLQGFEPRTFCSVVQVPALRLVLGGVIKTMTQDERPRHLRAVAS